MYCTRMSILYMCYTHHVEVTYLCITILIHILLLACSVQVLVNFFSQLFLLAQEMCLHHTGGFVLYTLYLIYTVLVLHSTSVFMVFCHENKVWYRVLFDIPPPLEVLETATFGILSISMPESWYSLTQVRYLLSVTPPSQWVRILSIHYVHIVQ